MEIRIQSDDGKHISITKVPYDDGHKADYEWMELQGMLAKEVARIRLIEEIQSRRSH